MSKTVYASFDYLYVKMTSDTDAPEGVYSMKDDDLMFFVFDNDATDDDFHAADIKLTERHTKCTYQRSGEYTKCQRSFYNDDESFNETYSLLLKSLNNDLKNVLTEKYSHYSF